MMETKEIFMVVTNSDLTEGRGYPVTIAYCENRATAERVAKNRGVMGSHADVSPVNAVKFSGAWCAPVSIEQPTSEDIAASKKIDEKSAAIEKAKLAGLTDDDLAAMGIAP